MPPPSQYNANNIVPKGEITGYVSLQTWYDCMADEMTSSNPVARIIFLFLFCCFFGCSFERVVMISLALFLSVCYCNIVVCLTLGTWPYLTLPPYLALPSSIAICCQMLSSWRTEVFIHHKTNSWWSLLSYRSSCRTRISNSCLSNSCLSNSTYIHSVRSVIAS